MSKSRRKKQQRRKRKIQDRLATRHWEAQEHPMLSASNIHYDLSDRIHGLGVGGIGAIHLLARQSGLIEAIDRHVQVLRVHLPYHESDHVLNIAYNNLCGGHCLEAIELRRNDEVYLDALGAQRIPDPTTAGDFCRRFYDEVDIELLMIAINEARLKVWSWQPSSFFEEAVIEADGTMVPTTGECKEGMDISYKGEWGYHPLVVTLANTGEVLYVVNRSGNRPSHDGATLRYDDAIELCRQGGFRRILLRGDTDFTQTRELDRWDEDGVRFIFGIDAMPTLKELAENLPKSRWNRLSRRPRYEVETESRARPHNVKEQVVEEREFKNIRLSSEDVAEFSYSPGACAKSYRIVVVRKNLSIERGENVLFDDVRYFFYITNDTSTAAEVVVLSANERCNQEKLIDQLKNGVRALHSPVDNLNSNWAYMLMASLAWTLKAWFALSLPESGRSASKRSAEKQSVLAMSFTTFLNAFMFVPAQIVKTGRRIVYRLLAWNPWQEVFFRAIDALYSPRKC